MAENSGIEWTTHTFNPWIGCTKVSAACDHCYAEAWDARFNGERWGPRALRTRTSAANWRKPLAWNKAAEGAAERPRVFCASLADVFDNHRSIPAEWRADLWAMIRETQNLDWLLLTKRPQNIARMLPDEWNGGWPNVWLGTTVETQEEADRRIPHLLASPASVHFLSCEPLLGKVVIPGSFFGLGDNGGYPFRPNPNGRIGWVIVGGESGAEHREADPDWYRSLRDQCAAADVPFLFKQWGGPHQRAIKAMGRELDGVVHDGYPTSEPSA